MTLALGLMSGTSCDGVSAALADIGERRLRLVAQRTVPYPDPLPMLLRRGRELAAADLAQLNVLVGECFALAALQLLRASRVPARRVAVIGSHGQTVYHGPRDPIPCTLQIGAPAVIAERTGIPVVADFRLRDVAAGGGGAPLVPYFDEWLFGRGPARALQNIGGIGNVTVVGRRIAPIAFDTGPGNCLIDAAMRRVAGHAHAYDRGGALAARGTVDIDALKRLQRLPYFRQPPPKSTGPELFAPHLIDRAFGRRWAARAADVVASLTALTAWSIAEGYRRFIATPLHEVIVSGGGAFNRTLMRELAARLAPTPVVSIARYGIPVQAKEPLAFALFALRALRGQRNHLPAVTGASGPRVLGTIVPA